MMPSLSDHQLVGDGALLAPYILGTRCNQTTAIDELFRVLAATETPTPAVLDLGCGGGDSYDALCRHRDQVRWVGIDVPYSPEVNARSKKDRSFCSYDGAHLPIKTGIIDIVFSKQVLEHVRHPEAFLDEAFRVLKTGGVLIGSTSQIEPFHSRSYWNFTGHGIGTLLCDAGFEKVAIMPGIDGLTLLLRALVGRRFGLGKVFDRWLESQSPLNSAFDWAGRLFRISNLETSYWKIRFSGHLVFTASKKL